MTHFKFSIISKESVNSYCSSFAIKVSSEEASFVIDDAVYPFDLWVPEESVDKHYFNFWNLDRYFETRKVNKYTQDIFDNILCDEYFDVPDRSVSDSFFHINFNIKKDTIKFGNITVPAHRSTRESFVEMLKYVNEQFDKLNEVRVQPVLQEYIKLRYRKEKPIVDEKTSKYLNNYFRSGKGTKEFRAEYVKMLLEHGSI